MAKTKVTHNEVLDMLVSAREFIQSGWVKGSMMKDRRVCSLGSIEAALRKATDTEVFNPQCRFDENSGFWVQDSPCLHGEKTLSKGEWLSQIAVADEVVRRLAATIGGGLRHRNISLADDVIIAFNDDNDTTKEDVLRLFDKTISRTRNRRPYKNARPLAA